MQQETAAKSDEELWQELSAGTARRDKAFRELYARHSGRIYQYCRRILGDTPQMEDVFQETFLRFLHSAESGRNVANVAAYLLRIARNTSLNARKSSERELVPFYEIRFPVQDSSLESRELARLVTMALEVLSDEHREAFVLQAYEGLSYREIAGLIGVPLSTVRNRVIRAKRKIREILAPWLSEYRR